MVDEANDPPEMTPGEKIIIEKSANAAITHKRITQIYIWAFLFALSFVAMTLITKSHYGVLIFALLYLAITTVEKILYGKAVLIYKSTIQKLLGKIASLEASQAAKEH